MVNTAVLDVTGLAIASDLVSQRKSSMEGLRRGLLSCCSFTSCDVIVRRGFSSADSSLGISFITMATALSAALEPFPCMCPWYILLRFLQGSLRPPDAFPRVYLHTKGGVHTGFSEGPSDPPRRLQLHWLAGGPLAALRAAGNCSPLGVLKADTAERGGGEEPSRPRSPVGAGPACRAPLKLTPPPNSFSLPARLPHVSLTLFPANPLLLPALT